MGSRRHSQDWNSLPCLLVWLSRALGEGPKAELIQTRVTSKCCHLLTIHLSSSVKGVDECPRQAIIKMKCGDTGYSAWL